MWHDLMQRLEGRLIALEPIREEHREPLRAAAADPVIWAWMQIDGSEPEGFDRWFAHALREAEAEREAPFVIIQCEGGAVLGSTRYMAVRPEHRGVEIGNTWLVQSAWSTGANVEAKLLMLEHAFERVGAMRVEFKTDARNVESRRALEALPATFEGILRKHMLIHAGIRDSAYYAITDDDWPAVKTNLERRLQARR
ncbi:MAG TPA: GNAT family protein [Gaiellaceae bacterium]|jgi:RimJ/RimL family protein N-acetyltransferase